MCVLLPGNAEQEMCYVKRDDLEMTVDLKRVSSALVRSHAQPVFPGAVQPRFNLSFKRMYSR